MRIMTFGINKNGKKGIINISEANEFAQQEILYTIPVGNKIANKFNSNYDIYEFLSNNQIECNMIVDLKPTKIYFKFDKYKKALKAFILDELILFEIEEEINLCKPNKNKLRKRGILNYIVNLFYRISIWHFIVSSQKSIGLKNIYVGNESIEEFQDKSFILLTLKSSHLLEKLYVKHKAFITN